MGVRTTVVEVAVITSVIVIAAIARCGKASAEMRKLVKLLMANPRNA